jgi:hypothetical protein
LGLCREPGASPVQQRHQRIDLGHDAVLFGERWEGNDELRYID